MSRRERGGFERFFDGFGRRLRHAVQGSRPPLVPLRLYRLGSAHTAVAHLPSGLFDPDGGLLTAGLRAEAVLDGAGRLRAAGSPARPGDGLLFPLDAETVGGRLQEAHPRLGAPVTLDLRDRSNIVSGVRVRISPDSTMAGRTLTDLRFRQRFWTVVTALWHRGQPVPCHWGDHVLEPGDEFVALGRRKRVEELTRLGDLEVVALGRPEDPPIGQPTLVLAVPVGSELVGASLRSSSLGSLVELSIVGIRRQGQPRLAISQEDPIRAGDPLLATGQPVQVLRLLQRGLVAAEEEVDGIPA